MNALFTLILEIIGTVAFSISGATVAMEKKMDLLGVAILGMLTAVGGGIMRDLILGITPPMAFQEPIYALLALSVAVICFIPVIRAHLQKNSVILLILDSIGLGVFTVIGVELGIACDGSNFFLAISVGVITGVGGGVLRDICSANKPYIFVKHFYATAAIIGAVLCWLLWGYIGRTAAMMVGAAAIIMLRLAAARFRWELPK